MWRRNKILIVGGSGFIGSYLLDEIKAENIDLKNGREVRYGIDQQYKTIIFLACNQENTHKAYKYNYEMFKALDDYRKDYPKTYLIYISSAAVYYPGSIYSQTKRLGEVYAKRFKNYVILRPSNVYGHGDGHGAPDRFLRGEKTIYGDGEYIRDLIPVEFIVDTIIEVLNKRCTGIFNVSSGVGTTVNEMFKLFGEGKPKHIKHALGVNMGTEKSILRPGRVE